MFTISRIIIRHDNLCLASSTPSELLEPNGASRDSPGGARCSPAPPAVPRSKGPSPAAVAPSSKTSANQDWIEPIVPQRVDVVGGTPPLADRSVGYHSDAVGYVTPIHKSRNEIIYIP